MRIHFFLHVPFESPGYLLDWADAAGHSYTFTRFYESDLIPKLDDFDLLVVMGGPMSIGDEAIYPWLAAEKEFIKQAIDAGKKTLGICLGSQLIAGVLGAKVYPNRHKEIGWFPVFKNEFSCYDCTRYLARELMAFHWHGDTFDLPPGAFRLYSSEATLNQAFSFQDHVLALQFHWEMKKENVEALIQFSGNDLHEGKFIQQRDELLAEEKTFGQMNESLDKLLQSFTKKM